MLIALEPDDLAEMPDSLRRELLDFLRNRLPPGLSAQLVTPDAVASRPLFELVAPPKGARQKGKKLLRLTAEQAQEFYRFFSPGRSEESYVVLNLIDELLHAGSLSPKELSACIGLRNKRGEPDARVISPHLKRITFAFRRFTRIDDAAWYVIDRDGNFYLDPQTLRVLRAAFGQPMLEEDEAADID